MKIGVVTSYDISGNYGNKLQNYAIIYLLSREGHQVDTIVTIRDVPVWKRKFASVVNRLTNYRLLPEQLERMKAIATDSFNQKYLNPNMNYLDGKDVSNDYDYFVIGSDQVWNPSWYDELKKEAFLLTFAKPEQKICISPSFGISELPDEWKPWFKEHLSTFPKISVREKEGAKIVKDLIGKDAEVLIDPTLMMNASEWREISEKPKRVDCNKPYILTYFLGGKTEKVQEEITRYCDTYGLVEYDLQKLNKHHPYASTPGEFVYMIDHAKLVATDSFHACVFSFLFQKAFLVYARVGKESNMMSRITTLLETFSLERKYVSSGLENDIFECDYENGFVRLKEERARFSSFVKKHLEKIEEK